MSRPGAAYALAQLEARCMQAAAAGEARFEKLIHRDTPVVVVGAGGSHPAAEFIARLLRDCGRIARAAEPLDAGGPEPDLIAVSYSGRTPDVAEAIRRHRASGGNRVTLIAATEHTPIAGTATEVLWHSEGELERGFMSFASTVTPAVAAAAGVFGVGKAADAVSRGLARQLQLGCAVGDTVDVFATGWAIPAALDLESKWAEGGLGAVRIHETKNFSHGRYMSVLDRDDRPTAVLLDVGDGDPYQRRLAEILAGHCELTTVAATGPGGCIGGLEVLAATQGLCHQVAQRAGIDVSRPKIPADGVELHHWDWTRRPAHR